MTTPESTSALSPYDTGDRCEPKVWIPYGTAVSHAAPVESFGKVDFEDEEGGTVCVVHVERASDHRHIVQVQPLCGDDELVIKLHLEDRVVTVDARLCRGG